jgi:hypothetical protein
MNEGKINEHSVDNGCQVWCFMPVIPALRRARQENHKFKSSLG